MANRTRHNRREPTARRSEGGQLRVASSGQPLTVNGDLAAATRPFPHPSGRGRREHVACEFILEQPLSNTDAP